MDNKAVAIKKEVTDIVTQAESYQIATQEQYNNTSDFLKAIKALEKKVKNCFDPICAAAKATHTEACSKRSEHLDPIVRAEKIVKHKLVAYNDIQEEIRRKEQAVLDKIAEAERRKKEEQEAAWRAKEEAKRKEAEKLAAEGKADEARKLQEAADRDAAKADQRAEAAADVAAPIVESPVEKPKGLSFREVWSAEVVDINIMPLAWLIPNQQAIDAHARATKGQIQIPGVKFNVRKIAAGRA